MSNFFKTNFDQLVPYEISEEQINYLVECCVFFETKNEHAQALNSPLLGVTPIYFTDTDVELFFTIFNVDEGDVRKIIANSGVTQENWVVTNDPYNQMVIYIAHRVLTSKLNDNFKETGLLTLFKLLHYKFFTSLIYRSYKYGSNKSIMEYVISNLSKKFDIIRYGTWKKVIEERSKDIYSPSSIHYKTLVNYNNDDDIIYILSDTQSRIRQKIVLINQLYHEAKDKNDEIKDYKTIDTIDGDKVIKAVVNQYESMVSNLQLQIQSPGRFLDAEIINVICSKFRDISPELFRTHLTMFCEKASIQAETKKIKEIIEVTNQKTGEKEKVYNGCNTLVRELIQKTYRYCMVNKVKMNSKGDILIKCINTYTSSRVTDPDIVMIKRSFVYFVIDCGKTKRPITVASLSLGMITYFILKSFNYL